jgi:hypothetical protein
MAYISSESVKAKREEIKKEFPSSKGWKFSIVREHHTSIHCHIMESPLDLGEHSQVNHFYIKEHYKEQPEIAEVLQKIKDILEKGNHHNSDAMTDYFDEGFYIHLEIGKWDRKHIQNKLS